MASIREREGKYQVVIRKKNCELSATFADEETAKLWAYYKEKMIDEIEAFEVPLKELFTLNDFIHLKIEMLKKEDKYPKTIGDINYLKKEFSEFLDFPMGNITYELLREKAHAMLGSIVRKGGDHKNNSGGIQNQQSPATVVRKMRYLGSVFSLAQEHNLKIDNPANRLCNELKRMAYA